MDVLYSFFDTNPIKEHETLELEQWLLNNINVQFSYYPVGIREIQRKEGMISSVYRGNTNRPNVTLNDKEYFPTHYQTSELCIYGNPLHQGWHSAELVIKHEPISSSVAPLYVCFFLYKKQTSLVNEADIRKYENIIRKNEISLKRIENTEEAEQMIPKNFINIANVPIDSYDNPANQLKQIIESGESADIDLSHFLQPYQVFVHGKQKRDLPVKWKLYNSVCRENGSSCFVVFIDNPIYIDSSTFDKIPNNVVEDAPFITRDISPIANSNTINTATSKTENNTIVKNQSAHYKEGFIPSGDGLLFSGDGKNEMVCEVIDDNMGDKQEINFYQMPLGGDNNKSQEKMNMLLASLYFVIGAMLVALTMILSPKAFDAFWKKYGKMLGGIPPALAVYAGAFIFSSAPVVCISLGVIRLDTGLTTIGVGLGVFLTLASVGILTMSKEINSFTTSTKE